MDSRPIAPAWHWLRTKGWTWQINSAFAKPELLKRLQQPECLLGSPTRVFKKHTPTQLPLVAQVELSEFPGSPLIVKHYRPFGFRQIAKDFFRTSSARREFETAFRAEAAGLPTATVIAAGEHRRWGVLRESYLISVLVPEAETLHALNLECTNRTQRVRIIRSFARLMAALHDSNFSHTDPSLTNFLVRHPAGSSPQICLIDLQGLKRRRTFPDELAARDLYRLLHRSHAIPRERLWFFSQYCRTRVGRRSARNLGRKVYEAILHAGYEHGLKANQVFGEPPHGGLRWRVRWPMVTAQVKTILRAPDQFLEQAKVLKPSRSSAVGTAGGVVLKRYNYRNWASRWKDMFRASRGRRSFDKAYRLEMAGVATARPIAAADRRRGGLVLRSYFVMTEIPGAVPLPTWTGDARAGGRKVAELLARLHDAGFTHRDLKGGNLVFDSTGRPHLIDLDGLRCDRRVSDEEASGDLARLARDIENWPRQISRFSRARFLVAYCHARKRADWRWWWRKIGERNR